MRRRVEDTMTRTVVVAREDAPFKELVRLMDEYRVSAVPVVDGAGFLMGIVSEADLLLKEEHVEGAEHLFEGRRRRLERMKAEGTTARELMTTPVVTIHPESTLGEAARLMHAKGVKRLPVVDQDNRIVGIVSRRDLLHVFLRDDEEIRREVSEGVIERTLWIDPAAVRVTVLDGVVSLEGEVERRSLATIMVGLVRGVDGVVEVEDRLTFRFDDSSLRPESAAPWAVLPPALRG
jgi:CBS-domain-containing membrane protein